MQELAGGEIASELVDIYPNPIEQAQVKVTYRNVNRLIGVDIPKDDVKRILDAMNISIIEETDDYLVVSVPTNKHDVTREADVIEEILRIYGFNQVEFSEKLNSTLSYTSGLNTNYIQNTISDVLTGSGYYEMMSLSIVQSKYFKEVLPIPDEQLGLHQQYIESTLGCHASNHVVQWIRSCRT